MNMLRICKFILSFIFLFISFNAFSEKYMLDKEWYYSMTDAEDSWEKIIINKTFEEQKIFMKKNDLIYYKREISYKETSDFKDNNEPLGIYIGKIEGVTDVYFNDALVVHCPYNNKSIYFKFNKKDMKNNNVLLIKINKNLTHYSCRISVVPYIDEYKKIRNNYFVINFFQILIGFCILFFGIFYSFYYDRKLGNYEFILFLLLCFFSFTYLITKISFKYFISEHFSMDFMILERIEYCSFYVQPMIGLFFLIKIFDEKSPVIRRISMINIMISAIFVITAAIFDYDVMSDSLIASQIFVGFNFLLYIILSVKSILKKNRSSYYILIGLILFIVFAVMEIENVLQVFNFGDRFSFYIIGLFIFVFTMGTYLSRQFININFRLIELKKSLEIKVADRTKKIEEIARQKDDFFANISHELRTPLTLILGPLESIISGKYGYKLNADDEKIGMMLYNGRKLLKLINDLLDFTKIEAGKFAINKQKTDISKLIRYFISSVKSVAENMGLNIVYNDNISEGKLITYTDRDMLEKSVFNLISNSLKYTPKGGQILIQTDKNDETFTISVKDSGIGIPDEKLDGIFERFNRIDNELSAKYEGTGIGLALTKELVNNLGGKITVRSKVNEGSVFSLIFPYQQINEDDSEENENFCLINHYLMPELINSNQHSEDISINNDIRKETILVVEDNPDMQKYLKSILENDYNLIFARNGIEGIERAEQDCPDLILSDVMMPVMDGYRMTELLKSKDGLKMKPVILLTAKSDISTKVEGFDKGADDYIVKPFDSKELCARIKIHLEIKRIGNEIYMKNKDLEKLLREKIQIQRHLEISEKKFREMSENLPVAIVEIDMQKNINYLNKYAEELLNAKIEDHFSDFLNKDDNETVIDKINSLYDEDNSRILICDMISKRHDKIKVLVKSNIIKRRNKIDGVRLTILEFEPKVNILLLPDKKFYEKYKISEREKDIINLLIKGLSYKDISENLFISYKTVDNHIRNIYAKTNIKSRNGLIKLTQEK
jgi:signal transduction histidine kinase/DNA-binding NarL/FixJ family response regulator